MKTEALCKLILGEIDNGTLPFYRSVLLEEPLSSIRDPLWLTAATVARKLDGEDQKLFLLCCAKLLSTLHRLCLAPLTGALRSTKSSSK